VGSSDSQKQFWRDPVKRLERFNAFLSALLEKKSASEGTKNARAPSDMKQFLIH